jgi:hypothetical protein
MSIKLVSTGGGSVTLDVPSTASDYTLTAPARTATVLADDGSGKIRKADLPSGTVLQVVNTVLTSATSVSSGGSFGEITGLATSITPISTSSRILVMLSLSGGTDNGYRAGINLVRNSTDIFKGDSAGSRTRTTIFAKNLDAANQASYHMAFSAVDSPSTTSSITYKVYASVENTSTFYVNRSAADSDSTSHYRAASSLIVMEIA